MGEINTEKKLELVRSIRMNQQNNRAIMGRREQILYGISPSPVSKGELYSLESTALTGAVPAETNQSFQNPLRSFKIRLIVAVVLFAGFIFADRTGQSFWGINSAKIHELITAENGSLFDFITNLLHF